MEILSNILSDISNFSLVIFGFCATLYTVFYSFILTKRDQLKELVDAEKNSILVPLSSQKQSNYIKYINNMKKFNKHIIICLLISIFLYLISTILKYLNIEGSIKKCIVIILISITLLLLFYILILIYRSIKIYSNSTKI